MALRSAYACISTSPVSTCCGQGERDAAGRVGGTACLQHTRRRLRQCMRRGARSRTRSPAAQRAPARSPQPDRPYSSAENPDTPACRALRPRASRLPAEQQRSTSDAAESVLCAIWRQPMGVPAAHEPVEDLSWACRLHARVGVACLRAFLGPLANGLWSRIARGRSFGVLRRRSCCCTTAPA
jgi:hypothetical protein